MFPWDLAIFAMIWLSLVFLIDRKISQIRQAFLMYEIEDYLTYLEMEQKEDDNG